MLLLYVHIFFLFHSLGRFYTFGLWKTYPGFPLFRRDKITEFIQIFKVNFQVFLKRLQSCFEEKSANLSSFIWTKDLTSLPIYFSNLEGSALFQTQGKKQKVEYGTT